MAADGLAQYGPNCVAAPNSHLQLVLLLLGDLGQQFGFLSGERLDQRVTLSHEACFELYAVLLKQHTQTHNQITQTSQDM